MTDVAIATTVERREDRWRQAVDQVRVFISAASATPSWPPTSPRT